MDARISPLSSQALNPTAGLQMKRPASSNGPVGRAAWQAGLPTTSKQP